MSLFEAQPRPTKIYRFETYDRIAKHHGFDGQGKVVLITDVTCIAIVSRSASPQEQAKATFEAAYPFYWALLFQASVTDSIR